MLIIRPERKVEYHASEAMVRRAFFNRQNPGCNEFFLVHLLRNSPDYLAEFSFVAELDQKIVGAIYFSKALLRTPKKDVPVVTFGPLAVDPLYQGLGIGRALFLKSVALLRSSSYPAIVIYGEPNYYPKLGFHRAKEFGITDPQGNVYDPLMVYPLSHDPSENLAGFFFESPVFEGCNDLKAVSALESTFPFYPKLKVPSQWLHESNLGQIEAREGSHFQIRYWEILIEADLAEDYSFEKPKKGDYVTFLWKRNGLSKIRTLEIPE